jgi:hypothetical protein
MNIYIKSSLFVLFLILTGCTPNRMDFGTRPGPLSILAQAVFQKFFKIDSNCKGNDLVVSEKLREIIDGCIYYTADLGKVPQAEYMECQSLLLDNLNQISEPKCRAPLVAKVKDTLRDNLKHHIVSLESFKDKNPNTQVKVIEAEKLTSIFSHLKAWHKETRELI